MYMQCTCTGTCNVHVHAHATNRCIMSTKLHTGPSCTDMSLGAPINCSISDSFKSLGKKGVCIGEQAGVRVCLIHASISLILPAMESALRWHFQGNWKSHQVISLPSNNHTRCLCKICEFWVTTNVFFYMHIGNHWNCAYLPSSVH